MASWQSSYGDKAFCHVARDFVQKNIFDFFLRPFLRIYSKKNQDKFNVSRNYYIYILWKININMKSTLETFIL